MLLCSIKAVGLLCRIISIRAKPEVSASPTFSSGCGRNADQMPLPAKIPADAGKAQDSTPRVYPFNLSPYRVYLFLLSVADDDQKHFGATV